jgi:uncharacterized membrane protein YfcA
MLPDTLAFYLVTAFVILLIGLSKGGLGGAAGGAATPLMALVMPPELAIGLLLPLLMITDVFAVAAHWNRWDRRLLILLVPASLIGITLGTALITTISSEDLRTGLGIFVLIFVLYKIFEARIQRSLHYEPRNWHGYLAGAVAGFSSTLAHTGGPPITVYLLLQNIAPRTFIATSAIYFAIINWIKVPYYVFAGILHPSQLLEIAPLLLLVPVGVVLGRWLSVRIDKSTFERVILVLLIVSAVLLLAQ